MTTTESENLLSLAELARKLGPADPDAVRVLENALPRDAYVILGAQMATERILTDQRRILGKASEWILNASPAQLKKLRGASKAFLAAAVQLASGLETAHKQISSGTKRGSDDREVRAAAARTAFQQGITLRDQVRTALKPLAAGTEAARMELDRAAGTAEDHTQLANGLDALAALMRKYLASPDAAVTARARLNNLDDEWAKDVVTAATEVRKTGAAAAAPRSGTVSQGELDLMDGINLNVLSEVIHAFEAAHDVDPAIPTLAPIATRRLLGKTRKKAVEKGEGGGTAVLGEPAPG